MIKISETSPQKLQPEAMYQLCQNIATASGQGESHKGLDSHQIHLHSRFLSRLGQELLGIQLSLSWVPACCLGAHFRNEGIVEVHKSIQHPVLRVEEVVVSRLIIGTT